MTVYANNVAGVIAADIGPTDTIIVLNAGQGALFPPIPAGNYFFLTLIHPITFALEIVRVTAKAGDALTVQRGRDGTTAIAFPASTVVEMRLVAEMMREVNWRSVGNAANGVPILDANGKVATGQLPTSIPYMVDNIVPIGLLPTELLTQTEGDAIYGRLDQAETWAENQTFAKNVKVNGKVSIANDEGLSTAQLDVGDDASFFDVGVGHTIALKSRSQPAWGFLQFGTGGSIGWNGSYLLWGVNQIWHGGTFNPADKTNRANGELVDGRILNFSGNPYSGTLFWGGTNDAVQTYDGSSFVFSKNVYAPNLVGTSDANLKKSIRPAPAVKNIGDMVELVSWEWRKRKMVGAPAGRHTGPIAQQVVKYAPHHVSKREDGVLGVDKAGLALEVAVDDSRRIRMLEAKVEELQALVRQLVKKIR